MATKWQLIEAWTEWTGEPAKSVVNLARFLSLADLLPQRKEALTSEHAAAWLIAAVSGCAHKDVGREVERYFNFMALGPLEQYSGPVAYDNFRGQYLKDVLAAALRPDKGIYKFLIDESKVTVWINTTGNNDLQAVSFYDPQGGLIEQPESWINLIREIHPRIIEKLKSLINPENENAGAAPTAPASLISNPRTSRQGRPGRAAKPGQGTETGVRNQPRSESPGIPAIHKEAPPCPTLHSPAQHSA